MHEFTQPTTLSKGWHKVSFLREIELFEFRDFLLLEWTTNQGYRVGDLRGVVANVLKYEIVVK